MSLWRGTSRWKKEEGRKRGRKERKKHSNQCVHAKDSWDLNGTSKVALIFGIFVFKEISLKTILSRMFHSNLWVKRCTVGKKVKKVEKAVRRREERGGDVGKMQKMEKMGICIFSMSSHTQPPQWGYTNHWLTDTSSSPGKSLILNHTM